MSCAKSQSHTVILKDDPRLTFEDCLQFRLTYRGPLLGSSEVKTRSDRKHEIRRAFHPQLKRLWNVSSALNEWVVTNTKTNITRPMWETLAERFQVSGYRFVPIVLHDLDVACGLDILFLRPHQSGKGLIQSGDLDNRLKTLFDALRMPRVGENMGNTPQDGEDPFFCLLEDDSLIDRVSVTTDHLLDEHAQVWDVHLVIDVKIQITRVTFANIGFGI